MPRDLDLPSGRRLHIQPAKFQTAKALYQAFAEEIKAVRMDSDTEIDVGLIKDLLCTALSSKKIESCLWECFKTVTIDGLKIDQDSFEAVDNRVDYLFVAQEVAKDNLLPFMKHLMPLFSTALTRIKGSLESKYQTKEATS